MKQFYNIYHMYEVFSGSRIDRVQKLIGMLEATQEEINAFLKEWNRPRVYFNTGDKLYEHMVVATPVKKFEVDDIQPYDPATRDWPDLPEGVDFAFSWDSENKKWVGNG